MYPESGRLVPELDDDLCREIIVDNYRVIYELRAAAVCILTVIHGARQLPNAP